MSFRVTLCSFVCHILNCGIAIHIASMLLNTTTMEGDDELSTAMDETRSCGIDDERCKTNASSMYGYM